MIDGREIIELTSSAGAPLAMGHSSGARTTSARRDNDTARTVLRFLENCPDEATVMELRDAIQEAFPGVLSGGGAS